MIKGETLIDFFLYDYQNIIFPCINKFNWSNLEDKELIINLPLINLFMFFVLVSPSIDVQYINDQFHRIFDSVC